MPCGVCGVYTKEIEEKRLVISRSRVVYPYMHYNPCGKKSYYEERKMDGYIDAYINLTQTPILFGGKLL